MPLDQTSYTPPDCHLSDPVTARAYIKAGQSFSRLTPLARDTTNPAVLVKWNGDGAAPVALSATVVDKPAGNEKAAIYVGGGFRTSAIDWPASTDADYKKCAAFLGSAIYVDDEA